ncbi:spermatogenesis-associated protein 22 isoform X3 [Callorhinchus milii]|nr:spermatogenesis-associated protein 22 isoform X3 [Callorhinchus milii]
MTSANEVLDCRRCCPSGCLPVLLFNQKKRARLPLTSNPTEHESSSSSFFLTPQSFDSAPAGLTETRGITNQTAVQNSPRNQFQFSNFRPSMDNGGCGASPQSHRSQSLNSGQLQQQAPQNYRSQEYKKFSSDLSTVGQNSKTSWNQFQQQVSQQQQSQEQKQFNSAPSTMAQSCKTNWNTGLGPQSANTWKENTKPMSNQRKEFGSMRGNNYTQSSTTSNFRSHVAPESNIEHTKSAEQMYQVKPQWPKNTPQNAARCRPIVQPNQFAEKRFDSKPGDGTNQDRDLPRLIRGQVHRCMGNYDKKRNLFKCVSVRPASVLEQKNFVEFVRVADDEMRQVVQTLSEV